MDNHTLLEDTDQSTAFFHQRLRMQTEFQIEKGLSLITRFDALEKIWGDQQWTGSRSNVADRPHYNKSSALEQENIEFEQAYIRYLSPIGIWQIGYVPHDTIWGTIWGTSERNEALIQWGIPIGKFMVGLKYIKGTEKSKTRFNDPGYTDADKDTWTGVIRYKDEKIETGFKWAWLNKRDTRPSGFKTQAHLLTPYFIWRNGPFKLETELEHLNGKNQDFEKDVPNKDVDLEAWSFYVNAELNQGSFYFGGTAAYSSGDDPKTTSKVEGASDPMFACWGGLDYDPALILWNEDRNVWIGPLYGNGNERTSVRSGVINALIFLGYVGYRPNEKWDIKALWLYAKADERPTLDGKAPSPTNPRFVDDEYGHEIDITASYKITNNLSYMVGAAYLWTGDYFKGTDRNAKVDDIYLLTHKLSLIF